MKYFFDTEFIEDGKTIDLISIGMVCEDGRELYLQNIECDLSKANSWVKQNVIQHLDRLDATDDRNPFWTDASRFHHTLWRTKQQIKSAILDFVNPTKYGKPQFWAYFADYDWVVLCQLFGRMIDPPKDWPMYCNDIKQLCVSVGDPKLPPEGKDEHHALAGAKWNQKAYNYLIAIQTQQGHRDLQKASV